MGSRAWPIAAVVGALEQVRVWSLEADGLDFGAAPVRLEVVNNEYGGLESYQARVYYRGPLRWAGPPRTIQLDLSSAEALLFPVTARSLHHPYSDAGQLPPPVIPCYDQAEMQAGQLHMRGRVHGPSAPDTTEYGFFSRYSMPRTIFA